MLGFAGRREGGRRTQRAQPHLHVRRAPSRGQPAGLFCSSTFIDGLAPSSRATTGNWHRDGNSLFRFAFDTLENAIQVARSFILELVTSENRDWTSRHSELFAFTRHLPCTAIPIAPAPSHAPGDQPATSRCRRACGVDSATSRCGRLPYPVPVRFQLDRIILSIRESCWSSVGLPTGPW